MFIMFNINVSDYLSEGISIHNREHWTGHRRQNSVVTIGK